MKLNAIEKSVLKKEVKRRQKEHSILGYFLYVNERDELIVDSHHIHPEIVLMQLRDELDQCREELQKLKIKILLNQ